MEWKEGYGGWGGGLGQWGEWERRQVEYISQVILLINSGGGL